MIGGRLSMICFFSICLWWQLSHLAYGVNNGYIVAESDGGLANRLRVLMAHMFIAEVLHDKAHLVFIWDVNDACPGHFLQFFKPIPTVTFASNSSRAAFAKNALKVYPPSRDGFVQTMLAYDVNLLVKKRLWWSIEMNLYRDNLILNRETNDRANSFLEKHDICKAVTVHVRKTDMDLDVGPRKRTAYESYFNWIDSQPVNESIYLMTDNAETQKVFYQRYGSRIIVYANITEEQVPISEIDIYNSHKKDKLNKTLAVDHRFTTLEHAVLDVFIAARYRDIRITPYSSVSELVKIINWNHRWKWCGCYRQGC